MQTNKILIHIGVCILCLFAAQTAWGQSAEATYTIRYNQTYSNNDDGDCWESSNEEYTMGVAYFFDNINTTVAGVAGCWQNPSTSCCDVTYGSLTTLGTRNNTSNILTAQIDVWEDDCGSRCAFGTCTLDSDDCRWNGNVATTNYRVGASPSNGTYTNWVFANSDHTITYSYTWKYSGSSNLITPTCTAQTAAYSAGGIVSWAVNLTAGVTYNFNNCTSTSSDTYMRIYGIDGFTVVASGDDNCGVLSKTPLKKGHKNQAIFR